MLPNVDNPLWDEPVEMEAEPGSVRKVSAEEAASMAPSLRIRSLPEANGGIEKSEYLGYLDMPPNDLRASILDRAAEEARQAAKLFASAVNRVSTIDVADGQSMSGLMRSLDETADRLAKKRR